MGDNIRRRLTINVRVTSGVLFIRMLAALIWVVVWVHFSACAWYSLGMTHEDSWARKIENVEENLNLDHLPINYVVSVHWAVAQLQGNVDVYPGKFNPVERAFAAGHVLGSIIVLTLFVSKITTVMQTIELKQEKRNKEVNVASRYCLVHEISNVLSQRVTHYISWKQGIDEGGAAEEPLLMKILPEDLRTSLLEEVRSP